MDCKSVSTMAKQNSAANKPHLMDPWVWRGDWLMIANMGGQKVVKEKYCVLFAIGVWQWSKSPWCGSVGWYELLDKNLLFNT